MIKCTKDGAKFLSLLMMLALLVGVMNGCKRSPSNSNQHPETWVIKRKTMTSTLHFNGPIQPIRVFPIVPLVDGFIDKLFFTPGTVVAKDQLLFIIISNASRDTYRESLINYIKAKRDLETSKIDYEGTEMLNKYGVISKQELISAKAKVQDAKFSEEQAVNKLRALMKQINVPLSIIDKLDPDNIQSINELVLQTSSNIKLFSPISGIAMVKAPSNTAGDTKLAVGSAVKANDPLIMIGDMSGVSVPIEINEVHIDEVREGEAAIVTGDSFPGIQLKGAIYIKERQPMPSYGGGAASYKVHIFVPHLTKEEMEKIRLGMNAQVTLSLTRPGIISVPLSAIYRLQGRSYVKRVNPKTQTITETLVMPGTAFAQTIEILSGLKEGDEIIVNAK